MHQKSPVGIQLARHFEPLHHIIGIDRVIASRPEFQCHQVLGPGAHALADVVNREGAYCGKGL
jgi:hypothetical protein